MQMERRELQQENAHDPISFNCDTARNLTSARREHLKKHPSSRTSIDEGTENEVRERSTTAVWRMGGVTVLSGVADGDFDI
jgi:hypothetical protein